MDVSDEAPGPKPDPALNEEIELESTEAAAFEAWRDRTRGQRYWASASAGVGDEATRLLRSRLLAAAGCLFVFNLILVILSATPDSQLRLGAGSLALRAVITFLVCSLLLSRRPLGYRQLRGIEVLLFGSELVLQLAAQYRFNIQFVDQGDLIATLLLQKNGTMRLMLLMLIYGIFIPNPPKITAGVVLSMAMSLIVCHALVLHHAVTASVLVDKMADRQNAIANALTLLLGAGLAVFSAYTLRGLRRELRNARRLGQYQLFEQIGAGGMGEVYLAEHQLLKRPCALKLIHADLRENAVAMARFEREVQSAAMLSHPNTIEIFDYGRAEDGAFYYVMEYLPGLSVHELVRQAGPMPPGRAVYLMRQVCGSLAEAHRAGLVHRDLKPGNIFVAVLGGQCDVAKVLDFGLVKQQQPADGLQLTAQYTVSGTPTYMSPEQAVGRADVDGRADLYALGAILYFMLTGEPPFTRDTPMALMIAHATEPVRPPSEILPALPADLEAVVLRCLAKQPADRFPDARSLAAALAACACASEWDQARAEQWWQAHAAAKTSFTVEQGESSK